MNNELIIYKKYLDVINYTNNILKKYPKNERFFLANQICNTMYKCQELILLSEKEYSKPQKLKLLNSLDVHLNMFKSYIRMSYSNKYISINNYTTWSLKITDVCNMLGGWIKECLAR